MRGYITATNLVPYPTGTLRPKVRDLLLALPLFALVHVLVARLLPRLRRAWDARHDRADPTEDRAETARARSEPERAERERARTEAPPAGPRGTGRRAPEAAPAGRAARDRADRAAAEVELLISVSESASRLVSRIVGDWTGAPVERSG